MKVGVTTLMVNKIEFRPESMRSYFIILKAII